MAGHDPVPPVHHGAGLEDGSGNLPPLDTGKHQGKRRHRRKRRKEKLRRLLRSQGLEPSSAEDPYRHSWDRERGRNYSSSEEEDGWQVLARASPPRRLSAHPTPRSPRDQARRRTPHHSTLCQQRYPRDAIPAGQPCGRRTRSLKPSLARDQQETQWENARFASSKSLHWTPSPRGHTYRCPSASCQIWQTQTATTTAWLHKPQQQQPEDEHQSEQRE